MSAKLPFRLALIAAALSSLHPAHADISPLGDLTISSGLSGDGHVVVGQTSVIGSGSAATLWRDGTPLSLGKLNGYSDSYAYGASTDGSVVAGESTGFDKDWNYLSRAFKWTQQGGMVALPLLASGQNTSAAAVSGDGSVIVGKGTLADGMSQHAVRWVGAAAPQDINGNGFTYSSALGVSGDGGVVVGYGENASGFRAFQWTSGNGMRALGVLAGKNASEASAVSNDGNVVVGISYTAMGQDFRAFRWSEAGGMTDLGLLVGTTTARATAVNADGSVVVGRAASDTTMTAFRWTSKDGMQSVIQWLSSNGVNTGTATLSDAFGVSHDGNVVTGVGQINGKEQAYIARIGAGGNSGGSNGGAGGGSGGNGGSGGGLVGMDDVARTLQGVSQSFAAGGGFARMAMFGAHHRVLADNALPSGRCFWATGDLGGSSNGDARQALGEVGVCADFGPWRIGGGLGASHIRQDLQLDGRSRLSGQHLYLEADYQFGGGLVASLAGFYGNWNADVTRHYQNGAIVDASSGSTDVQSTALRLRLDWLDATRIGSMTLSPHVAYSHIETHADAYSETGGGFPIAVDASRHTERDLRIGATLKLAAGSDTDLRLSMEGIHRFDGSAAVSGNLSGSALYVPGSRVQETQARIGAEVDHRLSRSSVLNASLHTTLGSQAAYVASLGWKLGF